MLLILGSQNICFARCSGYPGLSTGKLNQNNDSFEIHTAVYMPGSLCWFGCLTVFYLAVAKYSVIQVKGISLFPYRIVFLFASLFLFLSLCLYVSLSVFLCRSLSLSLSFCLPLILSFLMPILPVFVKLSLFFIINHLSQGDS